MRRPHERSHVVVEHSFCHQAVDYVERKAQVGALISILAHESKRLRRISREQALALAHRCLTHVVSGVVGYLTTSINWFPSPQPHSMTDCTPRVATMALIT